MSRRDPQSITDAHVGQLVRSMYRSPWTGIIIAVRKRTEKRDGTESPLCLVVPIWSGRGSRLKRRDVRTLDASWLRQSSKTPPSDIDPSWLVAPGDW